MYMFQVNLSSQLMTYQEFPLTLLLQNMTNFFRKLIYVDMVMNNLPATDKRLTEIPYSGNVWRGESLANLANHQ